MQTKKGIVINKLGDGGISLRAEWYNNAENVLIKGEDVNSDPELVVRVIKNIFSVRDLSINPYHI